jgi:predicted TIM-barrel fold metal-dependent hydrolase
MNTPNELNEPEWYPVLSVDTHLREPRDLYQERLPEHLRHRGARVESRPEGDCVMMGDKLVRWIGIDAEESVPASERTYKGVRYEIGRHGQREPEARKIDLVLDDVQGEVVYGFTAWLSESDREVVYEQLKVYNNWGAEAFADVRDRTCVVPMLPSWDPELSVKELTRVRKTLGHRAAQIGVPYVGDVRNGYANQAYDALWAAFVDLDMPVCAHIGSASLTSPRFRGPGSTLRDFMDTFLDSANAVLQFIAAGIFERFPKLRLVTTEGGIGWAPWMLLMMDRMWEEYGTIFNPTLSEPPSAYFLRNCLITWQDDEPGVRNLDVLGDAVAWGSDYPHAEGTFPRSREIIARQIGHLPIERQRALCGGNAARFFGFDLDEIARNYGPESAHYLRYRGRDGGVVTPDMTTALQHS